MGSRGPLFLFLECSPGTVCRSARAGKQRDCAQEGRGAAFLLWVFTPSLFFWPWLFGAMGGGRAWGESWREVVKVREGRENSEGDKPKTAHFIPPNLFWWLTPTLPPPPVFQAVYLHPRVTMRVLLLICMPGNSTILHSLTVRRLQFCGRLFSCQQEIEVILARATGNRLALSNSNMAAAIKTCLIRSMKSCEIISRLNANNWLEMWEEVELHSHTVSFIFVTCVSLSSQTVNSCAARSGPVRGTLPFFGWVCSKKHWL